MKKSFIRLHMMIIVACVSLSILSLSTCETLSAVLQDPLITIHSVDLASINLNGAQLLCKLQVENPNSFEIPFPETDWECFINTNSFIKGTIKNNNRLRARNKTIVEVPVNLDYLDLLNTFRSLKGNRKIDYKLALGIKFSLPLLGDKVWNLEHSGEVPLPQLPRITSPSMRVDNVNTSRAEIVISINFENPNEFPIPSPKVSYDYLINRNSFIKGEIENNGPLAASSTTPVNFRLTVNYGDLARTVASSITSLLSSSSRELTTQIRLNCDFNIPFFKDEQPFNWSSDGVLPLPR
ncbi:MAG: LEA type 2 family protein [Treponema sp.]|nr:LEA type 2 family protein [Treponema sp.]MCL2250604.1 LEA type 2 family protein [Treponema sp.]